MDSVLSQNSTILKYWTIVEEGSWGRERRAVLGDGSGWQCLGRGGELALSTPSSMAWEPKATGLAVTQWRAILGDGSGGWFLGTAVEGCFWGRQ